MDIIDNKNLKMSDVINSVMPYSKNLYFRTGYFFFSGYKEIYKNLKDKNLKILVGMDAQKGIAGLVDEISYLNLSHKSKAQIKKDYYNSLIKVFNDISDIDNKETAEAYEVFRQKILDGSLEIRKTVDSDHAKVYVFENAPEHNQNGVSLGLVIKGSSNLTFSGLTGQNEDNELHKDNDYFITYKQKFDELWESSIPLVDKDNLVSFDENVLNKIWINKLPKPYHIYLRVLNEYFSLIQDKDILTPSDITKDKINLRYQIDAISQALTIIDKHNGVIIADVVGLGKSIIASCIAKNMDMKTIIIAPPHLKQQWEDYRYEFRFNAKVYGTGSVLTALKENNDSEPKLIIIDEAHKFRNEEKSLYANLHRLCVGNKVVLLTATPFNNNPKDIFTLIKLFQIPAKSTIQTIDNLSLRFRDLTKQFNQIKKLKSSKSSESKVKNEIKGLADQIKDLLGPLLIRRSRIDLENINVYKEDLKVQGIEFPVVNPPVNIEYEFGNLNELYVKTLEMIVPENSDSVFKGARYNVIGYIKDNSKLEEIAKRLNIDANLVKNSQKYLAKFMKRLLVHRFESSVEAFRKTLDKIIASYETVQTWYSKGVVPIYKKGELPDIEDFSDSDGDEIWEKISEIYEVYSEKGMELVNVGDLDPEYIKDLSNDISLLKKIKEMWKDFDSTKDPKIAVLKERLQTLQKENPDRKIIIFSIYSDTVNYVYEHLKDHFRCFKYSSNDSSVQNKEIIRSNFDAGYSVQNNDFDILIATDAISEGYNLHRAGIIFNYDIPYNPTRVIQRVGRINRINKKVFDFLHIFNFFPSPTGEKETGVQRISTLKIDVIKALLGDDTQYLSVDEIVKSYDEKFKEEMNQTEAESWDTKYKNLIFSLKGSEDLTSADSIPMRTKVKRQKQIEKSGVLVFGRKGADYAFKLGVSNKETLSITASEAIRLFEAESSEDAQKVSDKFYEIYEYTKKNLFVRKSEIPKDKGLNEAIDKVGELKKLLPDRKDYFDDLEYIMKELGSLPAKFAKSIRAIRKESLQEDVDNLILEVPQDYLSEIIEKADSIQDGEESLILAEEL